MKIALIDGYIDEPSCLGVPPYISPHIRYVYGALLQASIAEECIDYLLVDNWRQNKAYWQETLPSYDHVIIISGTTVPGHYLSGKPISIAEIIEITRPLTSVRTILGGPLVQALPEKLREQRGLTQTIDVFCAEVAAISIAQLFNSSTDNYADITELINKWALAGAKLTKRHPYFPYVMCELETFRGCLRSTNCSFCSERLKRIKYQRLPQAIIAEVACLYRHGNRYFRLGCQTDLLSYGAQATAHQCPNQEWLETLYTGIREVAPELKVLHMDNINPHTIAAFPTRARRIFRTITQCNTPGDVAAFGLESADPAVLNSNHINSNPEQVLTAVRIMNEIGGKREEGIPKLLPGLNLLHGLRGETPRTMELNEKFLEKVLAEGLLLRRINVRQVQEVQNYKAVRINRYKFQAYKERINTQINLPMLKRVFPTGTILRDVIPEKHAGNLTFGRQIGSYPILVGICGQIPLYQPIDVVIIDHGFRSLTALPFPFALNKATPAELMLIPGIGKKRAHKIFLAQPLGSYQELATLLGPDAEKYLPPSWLTL